MQLAASPSSARPPPPARGLAMPAQRRRLTTLALAMIRDHALLPLHVLPAAADGGPIRSALALQQSPLPLATLALLGCTGALAHWAGAVMLLALGLNLTESSPKWGSLGSPAPLWRPAAGTRSTRSSSAGPWPTGTLDPAVHDRRTSCPPFARSSRRKSGEPVGFLFSALANM